MKTYLSVITFFVFLVSLSSFSFGTVIHVPTDYGTIQDAIDNSINGDTILVAKGTYSGTGNKNLNFNGLAITLKAEACPSETIINCGGSGRGIKFESGEGTDSVVDGFTIQNGVSSYGAGIYCDSGSSPTIKNCIIKGGLPGFMASTRGGGIYCIDGDPEIIDCTISNNGGTWGGGIYLEESSALIRGCTIVNNFTSIFGGTGYGGGIFCKTSTPIIENCDISGNFSGMWSPPFANNGFAGGIWIGASSQVQIRNCVLSNNGCVNGGGGIYIASAFPDNSLIINCTLVGNYSHLAGSNGGGIFCAGSDPNIQNCILWNNTSQSIQNQIYEDAGSSATVTYCDVWGGYVGAGNINLDPKFEDIDGPDNDATTWEDNDYTLKSTSPCIDTGLSTSATWNDKVGQLRCDYPPAGPGGGVHKYFDMGAYEFPVYFYADVATGSDIYTGLAPDKAKKTIQAAIDASTKGSTVLVAEGVYSGAGNNDLNFGYGNYDVPLRSIKGPEVTVIDCGGTGKGFDLRFEGDRVVIDGFKVVDAADSAMYIWASDIEVTNCILVENFGINGGGIETTQCDPVISNCIITGNTATSNGGGIYSRDGVPSLINSLIINNEASGNGGGIACYYNSSLNAENCTIADNTATGDGGGVYCLDSNPVLTNCILWDDSPDEIFLSSGTTTVTYSDVEGGYTGTGNINADPEFIDPVGSEDYRLKAISPCIDAGTSSGMPTDDMVGAPKFDEPETPNTGGGTYPYYDMGAYEFIKGFFVNGTTGSDCYDGLDRVWNGTHGPKKTIQGGADVAIPECTVYVAQGTYSGAGNVDVVIDCKPFTLKSEDGAALTIIDCAGQGRALYIQNSDRKPNRIEGFTITNGNGNYGGAIFCRNNQVEIVDCIIKENTATWSGGGIYASQSSLLSIMNCSIYGNVSEYGGGILADAVHGEIVNTTITGNEAFNDGGGIYWEFPEMFATNCTFAGNKAGTNGGAFYCVTNALFTNCILWGDTPNEIFVGPGGSAVVNYTDIQGGYGGTSNKNQDPQFLVPGLWNVGVWIEGDYHLQPTSPCIDVGDNNAPFIPGFDKDDNHRIWLGLTSCTVDMGAYEFLSEALAVIDMQKTALGIDITWTSSPSPGVTYDVWYCDEPISDSMTWTILALDVPTGGTTTTYTDTTSPIPYRRFYKISY